MQGYKKPEKEDIYISKKKKKNKKNFSSNGEY